MEQKPQMFLIPVSGVNGMYRTINIIPKYMLNIKR